MFHMIISGLLLGTVLGFVFQRGRLDATTTVRSITGGAMMSWGAAWAGGCTIGNAMVNTATFGFKGWTALLFMILGTGAATRIFITNHKRQGAGPKPVLSTVS